MVVRLDEFLEITSMEQGVKLVAVVLLEKPFNKWGARNILRNSWREFGEVKTIGFKVARLSSSLR